MMIDEGKNDEMKNFDLTFSLQWRSKKLMKVKCGKMINCKVNDHSDGRMDDYFFLLESFDAFFSTCIRKPSLYPITCF